MFYLPTLTGVKLLESIKAAIDLLEEEGFETQEMLEIERMPSDIVVLRELSEADGEENDFDFDALEAMDIDVEEEFKSLQERNLVNPII